MSKTDTELTSSKKHLAIAFVDIVSSTALMEQLGDENNLKILRDLSKIATQLSESHSGRLLKSIGDGFLASFDHASDAILFGTALRRFFKDHHQNTGATLAFRMSIHAGTVSLIDAPYGADVIGAPVALAARLNNVAGPNEIVISAAAMSYLS